MNVALPFTSILAQYSKGVTTAQYEVSIYMAHYSPIITIVY